MMLLTVVPAENSSSAGERSGRHARQPCFTDLGASTEDDDEG
jgi:hypothetical protein